MAPRVDDPAVCDGPTSQRLTSLLVTANNRVRTLRDQWSEETSRRQRRNAQTGKFNVVCFGQTAHAHGSNSLAAAMMGTPPRQPL